MDAMDRVVLPVGRRDVALGSDVKSKGRRWGIGKIFSPLGRLFRQRCSGKGDDDKVGVGQDVVERKLKDRYTIRDHDRDGCLRVYSIDEELAVVAAVKDLKKIEVPDRHLEVRDLGKYKVALVHARGDREEMEDRHLMMEISLPRHGTLMQVAGIFDGHGGEATAEFLQRNLGKSLQSKLNSLERLDDVHLWNALKSICVEVNDQLKQERSYQESGATALVTLVINDGLWVMNVGDSRAVLSVGGEAVQLSEDATPCDPKYLRGVIKRGGCLWQGRVNGLLAVARAFGDFEVPGMTACPKLAKFDLSAVKGQHNVLILACDGLWDVTGSSQAAKFVQNHPIETAAERLVTHAYLNQCGDNISVMLIDLSVG